VRRHATLNQATIEAIAVIVHRIDQRRTQQ
jgi:hypothetical protein